MFCTMKASGITKYPIKKGGDNTGETSMPKASPLSHLQVDSEVHFHVKTNGGVANFSAGTAENSIEVSPRPYSTKNFLPSRISTAPLGEMPFAIHLPVKPKTQPPNIATSPRWSIVKVEDSSSPRKRRTREEVVVISKVQKASAAQSKDASQNSLPRTSLRRRSSPNCDVESDDEVEIVDEVIPSPTRSLRKLNTASPQTGKKKKYLFDPKANEITMNEADIAPAMSADSFPDSQPGASNNMQCLSANGDEPVHRLEKRVMLTQTQSSDRVLPDLRQSSEVELSLGEKPSTSKATHQSMPIVNKSPLKREEMNVNVTYQNGVELHNYISEKLLSGPDVTLMKESSLTSKPSGNTLSDSLFELRKALYRGSPVALKSPVKRKRESSLENTKEKLVSSPVPQSRSRELKNLVINMREEFSNKEILTPSTSQSTNQSSASPCKKPKKSRELTSLYRNLDEINWAKESSFKKLLQDPNGSRHSDRSPKPEKTGSNNRQRLKKLIPKATKKVKAIFASKSNREQALGEKPKQACKPKASGSGNADPIQIKQEILDEDETEVFYMLNPAAATSGKEGTQEQETTAKGKALKSDRSLPKVKVEKSAKAKFSSLKSTTRSPSPEPAKGKKRLKCISFVSIKTPKDASASTSGLQKNGRSKSLPSIPRSAKTEQACSDASIAEGDGEELILACQNASKLQVRVQPLEHTNFWTNEFYEGVRKHLIDQAIKRAIPLVTAALESREVDSAYAMLQDMRGTNGRRRKPEEEALRCSARQSEGAFRYKEIVVKRQSNYMQLVLVPNTAKQNSLTVEAMKELKEAFLLARKDPSCKAVLINSSGPYFCTGIDLAPLVGNNKKQAAEEIALSIKDLVMTLSMFPKPVVAAVNGAALGFGVSLLTYCDVVLASDKATFCLPATKIGYVPEGGVTYTLPQVVGSSVASEMLMQGRRITAEQACKYGLVSEVIWPTRLMNEVIPRLQNIISQPSQGLEATKTMVRCRLWDKLKMHVERERELLCEHWASTVCQNNIKTLLQTGWLLD